MGCFEPSLALGGEETTAAHQDFLAERGIQTAMLLAIASGAAIHERVDGVTTFAVNRLWSGLSSALRVEKLDGADHRPQFELTLADRTVAPFIRYRLKSEAFAVPESQRDAVAEGVEKVQTGSTRTGQSRG
jgi:hypothetical protein